jgi:hypothetical protein
MKAQQLVPLGGRNSKTVDGKTLTQKMKIRNVSHDVPPRTIKWNLTTFSTLLTFIMLRL